MARGSALAQDTPSQQSSPRQGNSQPQRTPQEERKDEGTNPAQLAATKTVQAAVATRKVGKAALFKARDWESCWLTGVFVGRGQPRVPLTSQERQAIYLQQMLVTPGA
jgi:hypothetical protein